ncbi:MAG: DUF2110 family protein [Candidatus Bathyarchaeia archaeon]
MPTVTLLEKLYGDSSVKSVESRLQAICGDLKITIHAEATERSWIRVEIGGEDAAVAIRLIEKQFGLAPTDAAQVKEGFVYAGRVVSSQGNSAEMRVDLGVFFPSFFDAFIPLQHLQAQLVDGRKMPLQRIAKLFCLLDNFPLEVLIKSVEPLQKRFLVELSEKQIMLFNGWVNSNLDRVVVLGAFFEKVENVVKEAGHFRDVVEVESLGLLEQSIICKVGTDAAGLIPKIGKRLPRTVLGVFSPKEIMRYAV